MPATSRMSRSRTVTPDAWQATLDRCRRADAAFRAEIPSRCGWCGGRSVPPVYATNRRTWCCLDCRKEFTPGATG